MRYFDKKTKDNDGFKSTDSKCELPPLPPSPFQLILYNALLQTPQTFFRSSFQLDINEFSIERRKSRY